MRKRDTVWLTALPSVLGGSLFFVGAARFLLRGDAVGAAIGGFSGLLATALGLVSYSRKTSTSD